MLMPVYLKLLQVYKNFITIKLENSKTFFKYLNLINNTLIKITIILTCMHFL